MKTITLSLCTLLLLATGNRRDLQSTPWTLDVEQLSGSCEEADLMFHNLWNDASNLCSATINRMTPPAICKQQNSQPCPPGVEADCPDADPFNKVCVVNFETCARSLNEQFWEGLLSLAGPIGDWGNLGWYAMKGATAGVYGGLFGLGLDAQINYGEAVKEAKLSFRKLFHDYPDMLMELVEHSFAQHETRESMSEGWSRVSQHTQQTILAHACRWEADKALRYVDFDLLMEDMKSKSAFYDLWLNDQGSCFSAVSGDNNHEIDNQALDCVNKASSLIGLFDPTGISALVGQATKLDWCPDIHDDNDPHYSPRAALSEDHPWHSVKEKLAESLRVGAVANAPYVENSRGDGESMAHQLRRKLLSQACPTEYQFSKGVCRPVSIGQHITWGQTLVHYHDTRPQLIFVDEGSASNDQCCDKEGMTTIRTASDCQRAAQELRPWGSFIGTVNDDSIPYGCYADIRTEDVGFNTNPSNRNLVGFYEPICGAGDNLYEIPDFNIIRVAEGYVMGSLGEACPDEDSIVRAEDCAYAIEQMTINNPQVQNLVANTGKMGGCSLHADESLGFYNDKHPRETNVPDKDPAFDPQENHDSRLYKSVKGNVIPSYSDCASIPDSAPYIKLVMGSVVDYFRPIQGRTYCDMLNSNSNHQWSKDGKTFVTPQYHEYLLGGSSYLYPKTIDGRTYLPFWGGNGAKGGCCHTSYKSKAAWHQPFELYYPETNRATIFSQGSFPICYTDGQQRTPKLKQRTTWTDEYWFYVPSCPSGYYYSGGYKRCGWGYCAECYQPYYSCDDYPNHLLVEGRRVPSTDHLPVAVCLDQTKLGNA